jgi:SAM-dependent methyltransferase
MGEFKKRYFYEVTDGATNIHVYQFLLKMNYKQANTKEFNPDLSHPYYLIRSGLYKSIRQLSPALGGKLLDLGCGSKPYQQLFNCEEYIGIDFVNPGHPHESENIDIYYDGKTIPFPDNHFDSILCSEVFEHIFNLDEVLIELHRVLKPGGSILITCPFIWKEHETPNDFARYTLFALESILTKQSFVPVATQKAGNFIEAITQIWILFLYDHVYSAFKISFLTRIPFKFIFFILPNMIARGISKFFKVTDTLYLNNVILYKKAK